MPPGSRRPGRSSQGAAKQTRWIVFFDESCLLVNPPIRRTWAPRGRTPVVVERRRSCPKVSMAAFVAYRPDGSQVRLGFDLHQGAYDTAELIRVLEGLPDRLGGPVTLIWDNLPAHKSGGMRDWVSQQADWLQVVYLPAYAPDLNPVEGLWATLKGCDLANHGCYTAEELIRLAQVGLIRLRRAPELLWGFLRHAGLPLATSPT